MPAEDVSDYEPSPWEPIADQVDRYLATDGEEAGVLGGAPCVILDTVGKHSGKLRRTPLMKVVDGDDYVVVASLGGAPQHPQWYHNVVADPEVVLHDFGTTHRVRARTAPSEEKAERWPSAVAAWPAYADYQAATERDIPLVVLEAR